MFDILIFTINWYIYINDNKNNKNSFRITIIILRKQRLH